MAGLKTEAGTGKSAPTAGAYTTSKAWRPRPNIPLTTRDRQLHAFVGSMLGLGLGIVLDIATTDATGHWLWLWIAGTMTALTVAGFYAPRWLIKLVALALTVFTA
jgi:hypothetical protein